MDTIRDFGNFKTLIARLCSTMGHFCTDELIESWWKALKHVDYGVVEGNVDRFLGKADEGTKFPRPAQMRPKDLVPPESSQSLRNYVRDYWRSCVVADVAQAMGYRSEPAAFERLVADNAETLGKAMRGVINEMEDQERTSGRTDGMHRGCLRICRGIAMRFSEAKAA